MQHLTVYLFLENCSICFWWYLHPSSGAHTTVFTVSGICQTVTATYRCCGRIVTGLSAVWELYWFVLVQLRQLLLMMGGDITRNMWSSFPKINRLCDVAYCWKYTKMNMQLNFRALIQWPFQSQLNYNNLIFFISYETGADMHEIVTETVSLYF